MLNKKIVLIFIAIILLIGLAIGSYFIWNKWKKSAPAETQTATEKVEGAVEKITEIITESATKGALPSLGTNPLENKPEINPVDKTNLFKDIKTNPFE